jgi:hypothetical protein
MFASIAERRTTWQLHDLYIIVSFIAVTNKSQGISVLNFYRDIINICRNIAYEERIINTKTAQNFDVVW